MFILNHYWRLIVSILLRFSDYMNIWIMFVSIEQMCTHNVCECEKKKDCESLNGNTWCCHLTWKEMGKSSIIGQFTCSTLHVLDTITLQPTIHCDPSTAKNIQNMFCGNWIPPFCIVSETETFVDQFFLVFFFSLSHNVSLMA